MNAGLLISAKSVIARPFRAAKGTALNPESGLVSLPAGTGRRLVKRRRLAQFAFGRAAAWLLATDSMIDVLSTS